MIQEYQLRLSPRQASSEENILDFVARDKGIDKQTVKSLRILKRSIDARQRNIFINLKVRVYINELPEDDEFPAVEYPDVSGSPATVVVGMGPAGLFCALKLIELGIKPIVLERGKPVNERKKDLARIPKTQQVDEESNYCFGEGGAGTYSDGKLYTRSKKRGSVEKILHVFCQHGASASILADAHPHIGTNRLPLVVENMRKTILGCGGEVHFHTKMTSLVFNEGRTKVTGVKAVNQLTATEETYDGPVILATGHSARDIYRYLEGEHIEMEAKGIAVGVRLEHPSSLIDRLQYHQKNGRGDYLPAAEYSFVTQVDGQGVYSFCMCPGGFVIPSATGPGQIVVNGMSTRNRGSAWSNSGMVVEVHPEDILSEMSEFVETGVSADDPLLVMHFQERLEHDCWLQGNRQQSAPAQRMADFVNGKLSCDLPKSSYTPGLISSPLHFWMPSFISKRLQQAFKQFGARKRGFLTNDAILIGVETRTSSPVRILRRQDTLQHVAFEGLFPCGEGAGYSGGIVSSAIDGERCAGECARWIRETAN